MIRRGILVLSFVFGVLFCGLNGAQARDCGASLTPYGSAPSVQNKELQVFSVARPRAVVLLAHGLNMKPEAMDPLAEALQMGGAEVFRLGLAGHRGDSEAMKTITAAQWKADFISGYLKARKRSDELKVPLEFLGYSLGALVGAVVVSAPGAEVRFERQVLLAPALKLTFKTSLIRALGIFGRSFCVLSANSPERRANNGTTVAAYDALFELVAQFRESDYRGMDIPTLVIADPDDELVNFEGLMKDAKKLCLNNWAFDSISTRDAAEMPFHHVITDSRALGPKTWAAMLVKIETHFGLAGGR